MQAVISGEARTAFLVNDGQFASISADDPETVRPRSGLDFHRLFQFSKDVSFLEEVTEEEVRQCLDAASRGADVIALVLRLLDPERPSEIRREFADDLGQIIDAAAAGWAERLLLAQCAPVGVDFAGAIALSDNAKCVAFLRRIEAMQPFIEETMSAWSSIPDNLFDGLSARTEFDAVVVREGVFRDFVRAACAETTADAVVSNALALPAARAFPARLQVLAQWRDRLCGQVPPASQRVSLPHGVLRALHSISERLALALAQTLSITARYAFAASQHAPVPAVGNGEWIRIQVPLDQYFRVYLGLPDHLVAPWVNATLSVQRRSDRLRFVLNCPPPHHALAISIANGEPVELDSLHVVAEIEISSATSVTDLQMAIIPFRRETPAN